MFCGNVGHQNKPPNSAAGLITDWHDSYKDFTQDGKLGTSGDLNIPELSEAMEALAESRSRISSYKEYLKKQNPNAPELQAKPFQHSIPAHERFDFRIDLESEVNLTVKATESKATTDFTKGEQPAFSVGALKRLTSTDMSMKSIGSFKGPVTTDKSKRDVGGGVQLDAKSRTNKLVARMRLRHVTLLYSVLDPHGLDYVDLHDCLQTARDLFTVDPKAAQDLIYVIEELYPFVTADGVLPREVFLMETFRRMKEDVGTKSAFRRLCYSASPLILAIKKHQFAPADHGRPGYCNDINRGSIAAPFHRASAGRKYPGDLTKSGHAFNCTVCLDESCIILEHTEVDYVNAGLDHHIQATQNRRRKRLELLRSEQETREVEDCTFFPDTTHSRGSYMSGCICHGAIRSDLNHIPAGSGYSSVSHGCGGRDFASGRDTSHHTCEYPEFKKPPQGSLVPFEERVRALDHNPDTARLTAIMTVAEDRPVVERVIDETFPRQSEVTMNHVCDWSSLQTREGESVTMQRWVHRNGLINDQTVVEFLPWGEPSKSVLDTSDEESVPTLESGRNSVNSKRMPAVSFADVGEHSSAPPQSAPNLSPTELFHLQDPIFDEVVDDNKVMLRSEQARVKHLTFETMNNMRDQSLISRQIEIRKEPLASLAKCYVGRDPADVFHRYQRDEDMMSKAQRKAHDHLLDTSHQPDWVGGRDVWVFYTTNVTVPAEVELKAVSNIQQASLKFHSTEAQGFLPMLIHSDDEPADLPRLKKPKKCEIVDRRFTGPMQPIIGRECNYYGL